MKTDKWLQYAVRSTKLFSCLLLLILIATFHAPLTLAATDPQSATVSATATVPSASANPSDNMPPYPIILISPTDGSVTNLSRPEFIWHQTSDPNSNTIFYTVLINGVATYLGISNTGNTQQSNFVSHIGDGNIYLNPTVDLPVGKYNWQVVATDLSSNQTNSASWHFTIDQTPPSLQIIDIDGIYHNPTIIEGSNFDLAGPQDINFAISTEPWATISLKIYELDNTIPIYSQSYPTDSSGLIYPSYSLNTGIYTIEVTSFDHAGYTTTLPLFSLTLTKLTYNLPIPAIPGITQPTTISYSFPSIPSLPATISQIKSNIYLPVYAYILLAVAIIALLIYIWYRRPNILIIDTITNKPIRSIKIYHSAPTTKHHGIYVTNQDPLLYELTPNSHGLAHINHLGRLSTLTLRTPDNRTLILSISLSQRFYTLSV